MQRGVALDDLERSLSAALQTLSDRATATEVIRRCGYDLPPASWALLEHLHARGALRVSDIAACHGVDISSISPRLKRLETDGMVARGREPTDARASIITITDNGVRALESIHAARREILEHALGTTDPARLALAAEVLALIAAHRTTETAPPASHP